MPTKTYPTAKAVAWLKGLALPEVDRLEVDHLLADLGQADRRLKDLEQAIARRSAGDQHVAVLSSMPGVGGGSPPCPWPAGSAGWTGSHGPTAWPTTGA